MSEPKAEHEQDVNPAERIWSEANGAISQMLTDGKVREAVALGQELARYSLLVFGKTSLKYVAAVNTLGTLYADCQEWEQCLESHREAVVYSQFLADEDGAALREAVCMNVVYLLTYLQREDALAKLLTDVRRPLQPDPGVQIAGDAYSILLRAISGQAADQVRSGHLDLARRLASISLAGHEALGPIHDAQRAVALLNLATIYMQSGDFEAAEPLVERAFGIWEVVGDADNANLPAGLAARAALCEWKGDLRAAEAHFKQAINLIKEKDEWSQDLASVCITFAENCRKRGWLKDAELHCQRAIEICIHNGEGESLAHAAAENNLGLVFLDTGRFDDSLAAFERVIATYRALVGANHPLLDITVNNLGLVLAKLGRFDEAEGRLRECLANVNRRLGDRHPVYLIALETLAILLRDTGRYSEALQEITYVLQVRREVQSESHPDYARALNNVAELNKSMGNYEEAERKYQLAMANETKFHEEHGVSFATTLSNLADLYIATGRYREARPLLMRAMSLIRDAVGKHSGSYASCLSHLGRLYFDTGDAQAAFSLEREAGSIHFKLLGDKHPDYVRSLFNQAAILLSAQQTDEAWRCCEELAAIVGDESPAYGLVNKHFHSLLASLHEARGNIAKAESCWRECIRMCKTTLGNKDPLLATALNDLGLLLLRSRRIQAAADQFTQALRSCDDLADGHPLRGRICRHLAVALGKMGQWEKAFRLSVEASRLEESLIVQVFGVVSERQREAHMQEQQFGMSMALTLWHQAFAASAEHICVTYMHVLRRKSLLAATNSIRREYVLRSSNIELYSVAQRLTALRSRIAQLAFAERGPEQTDGHSERLDTLLVMRDRLEEDLAAKIPSVALERMQRSISPDAVAGVLPPDAILVDFVRYDVLEFWSPSERPSQSRYMAFVTLPGSALRAIDLDDGEAIDSLTARFLAAIRKKASGRSEYRRLGEDLRRVVFDKILDNLPADATKDLKRVVFAPDGDLYRLPFEVLPMAPGKVLLDKYEINYVTAARDLIRSPKQPRNPHSASVVVADPDFDLATESNEAAATGETLKLGQEQLRASFQRGGPFSRLEGTSEEGKLVAALLGVEPWIGSHALDRHVKGVESPQVLHIATHGIFLENDETKSECAFSGRLRPCLSGVQPGNPLLRSALALAGINTWLTGNKLPPEAEDGMLTADDVCGMSLEHTSLVVLSACETGLGDVRTGEGVFGLRRAFVEAGAESLVMSLWPVTDRHTKTLMESFYRLMKVNGTKISDALRGAQAVVRKDNPDPFYWGGFIFQGDPDAALSGATDRVVDPPPTEKSENLNQATSEQIDWSALCSWLPNPIWNAAQRMFLPASRDEVPTWKWHDFKPKHDWLAGQEVMLLEEVIIEQAETNPKVLSPQAFRILDRDERASNRKTLELFFKADSHPAAISAVLDSKRNRMGFCLYLCDHRLSAVVKKVITDTPKGPQEETATRTDQVDAKLQEELSLLHRLIPIVGIENPHDPIRNGGIPKFALAVENYTEGLGQLVAGARILVVVVDEPNPSVLAYLRKIAALERQPDTIVCVLSERDTGAIAWPTSFGASPDDELSPSDSVEWFRLLATFPTVVRVSQPEIFLQVSAHLKHLLSQVEPRSGDVDYHLLQRAGPPERAAANGVTKGDSLLAIAKQLAASGRMLAAEDAAYCSLSLAYVANNAQLKARACLVLARCIGANEIRWEESLEFYQSADNLFTECQHTEMIVVSRQERATILCQLERLDEARITIDSAIALHAWQQRDAWKDFCLYNTLYAIETRRKAYESSDAARDKAIKAYDDYRSGGGPSRRLGAHGLEQLRATMIHLQSDSAVARMPGIEMLERALNTPAVDAIRPSLLTSIRDWVKRKLSDTDLLSLTDGLDEYYELLLIMRLLSPYPE